MSVVRKKHNKDLEISAESDRLIILEKERAIFQRVTGFMTEVLSLTGFFYI